MALAALVLWVLWLTIKNFPRRPRPPRHRRVENQGIPYEEWKLARDNGMILGAGHWNRGDRAAPGRPGHGGRTIAPILFLIGFAIAYTHLPTGLAVILIASMIGAIALRQ
ncbi:MAG: hypothetical protein MH825_08320 [Cyanobacteria bacterium]|nr:hypothetical protein [Cyanobacteriota bacterium]